jgi:hypothetical protein
MTVKKEVATTSVATTFLNSLQVLTSDYIILCEGKEKLQTFRKYAGSCTPDSSVNTYYTVNPRFSLPMNHSGKLAGQGTKEHIKEVIAFYADVEAGQDGHKKTSFYQTKEEALKTIRSFKYRPSFIIDSGHGYHCLWLFKEPYILGEDVDLEYYEAMNRGIQKVLKADTTADVTRILRVPGSFNVKDPAHPVKCELVDNSGARYNLEDFEDYITPVWSTESAETELHLKLEKVKTSRKNLSPRINKIISEGADPSDPSNTDRSSLIQTVVDAMVAKGFTDNEIYTVLTDKDLKISEKILTEKKTEMERKRYIALSISKARTFIKVQQKEAEATTEEMKTGLTVLGYTKDHKVMFWHKGTIQEFELKRITPDDLCLLTGKDEMAKDAFNELKKFIRQQCNFKGIIKEDHRMRNGIWKLKNRFVIVSGEDILEVKDMEICRLDKPVVDGRIVEFEEKWLNVELFQQVFKEASIEKVYQELSDYIGKWQWRDPEMVAFVVSFVMLAGFQQAMKWRPWLYFHARPGSGKTLFFENVVQRIYGPLAIRLDKATDYATAQNLNRTGKIPLLDNFEPNKKSQKILDMFQAASRGIGTVPRGTTGDKAKNMQIYHMLWFNSAIPAIDSTASDTRTVMFKLDALDHNIDLMTSDDADLLLAKLLAVMLKHWWTIEKKAADYIKEFHERKTENVAYALAIQEIVTGDRARLPAFINERELIDDEGNLLDAMMRSKVVPDGGNAPQREAFKRPVFEILLNGEIIESSGIKVIHRRDGKKHLAVHPATALRYLLQDIPAYRNYAPKAIEEILLNLGGAEKQRQKLNGSNQWLVTLPYSYLEAYLNSGEENE